MKTKVPQYTIRNLPESVDRYLRRRAMQSGRSLNQTIIDELSERAGTSRDGKPQNLLESLSWFIGSGMDQGTLDTLTEEDREQKAVTAREMAKLDEITKL
jgi:response regulator of citrate/malate metabolism